MTHRITSTDPALHPGGFAPLSRLLFAILLALGLSFVVAFEVGPVAAQEDRDPTTTSTAPATTTTEPAGSVTTPTTTTTDPAAHTTDDIGYGPNGDVIDPSPWEDLRRFSLVVIPIALLVIGGGVALIAFHKGRRTNGEL